MGLRKAPADLTKITLNVFSEDLDWFRSTYLKSGYAVAIRKVMRKHKMTTEKKMRESKVDVEIELEA